MHTVCSLMRSLRAQFKGRKSALPISKVTAPTKCIVNGRVATDPERHDRIATFVLAVRSVHNVKGAFTENTTFLQVKVIDQMANHCMRHLTTGKAVTITGTAKTTQCELVRRRWLRRKRRPSTRTTYLMAHTVQFV
jgi:single-stranded DNA-binding protein